MTILQMEVANLTSAVHGVSGRADRFLREGNQVVELEAILSGSTLYGRADDLQGRSVLLATHRQLTTASALMELDGIARRLVLCPPDLPVEHLSHVMELAQVDGIVTDRDVTHFRGPRSLYFSPCSRDLTPASRNEAPHHETEWVLLTSGTTGPPKLVAHTLESLAAAIRRGPSSNRQAVWSTFYDIRRYGGLQILLRALLTGTPLVLSEAGEATADFLERAASCGVTHISGTPSHWRRALMSPSIHRLNPEYVRLSGEAPDQTTLNQLREAFPKARIVHAFASTEAGLAFEVDDGAAGFAPQAMTSIPGVEMTVNDGTLCIRSRGNARCYLGENSPLLKNSAGWVDTGDLLEMRDGRYYFCGRRDGVINVGGLKVHPEEVESVLGRHPQVRMCVVRGKKSRITGALVVADVVLRGDSAIDRDFQSIEEDILHMCREILPAHKVPAAINIVPMLSLSESGKVLRRNA